MTSRVFITIQELQMKRAMLFPMHRKGVLAFLIRPQKRAAVEVSQLVDGA
jgi:hypothetical protein